MSRRSPPRLALHLSPASAHSYERLTQMADTGLFEAAADPFRLGAVAPPVGWGSASVDGHRRRLASGQRPPQCLEPDCRWRGRGAAGLGCLDRSNSLGRWGVKASRGALATFERRS